MQGDRDGAACDLFVVRCASCFVDFQLSTTLRDRFQK